MGAARAHFSGNHRSQGGVAAAAVAASVRGRGPAAGVPASTSPGGARAMGTKWFSGAPFGVQSHRWGPSGRG